MVPAAAMAAPAARRKRTARVKLRARKHPSFLRASRVGYTCAAQVCATVAEGMRRPQSAGPLALGQRAKFTSAAAAVLGLAAHRIVRPARRPGPQPPPDLRVAALHPLRHLEHRRAAAVPHAAGRRAALAAQAAHPPGPDRPRRRVGGVGPVVRVGLVDVPAGARAADGAAARARRHVDGPGRVDQGGQLRRQVRRDAPRARQDHADLGAPRRDRRGGARQARRRHVDGRAAGGAARGAATRREARVRRAGGRRPPTHHLRRSRQCRRDGGPRGGRRRASPHRRGGGVVVVVVVVTDGGDRRGDGAVCAPDGGHRAPRLRRSVLRQPRGDALGQRVARAVRWRVRGSRASCAPDLWRGRRARRRPPQPAAVGAAATAREAATK